MNCTQHEGRAEMIETREKQKLVPDKAWLTRSDPVYRMGIGIQPERRGTGPRTDKGEHSKKSRERKTADKRPGNFQNLALSA